MHERSTGARSTRCGEMVLLALAVCRCVSLCWQLTIVSQRSHLTEMTTIYIVVERQSSVLLRAWEMSPCMAPHDDDDDNVRQ